MPATRFYNLPRPATHEDYHTAVSQITDRVAKLGGAVALYTVGNVGVPGISDLDVLVVFEDDAQCDVDLRAQLPEVGRYLFTHGLFGASRSGFDAAQRFTFYRFSHCWGEQLQESRPASTSHEREELQSQIAREYLLSNFISRFIEASYGIASLRNVFLSVNAIRFDLEFLGVTDGPLHRLVTQLIEWRSVWFERPVSFSVLEAWLREFIRELEAFTAAALAQQPLLIPAYATQRMGRHVALEWGMPLRATRSGVRLPPIITATGKFAVKMQNRLNRFRFRVPAAPASMSPLFEQRFQFLRAAKAHNRERLPHFVPLTGTSNFPMNVL